MKILSGVEKRQKVISIILILFIGLLNFHPPHFLIETHKNLGYTSSGLEFGFALFVIAAIVSAIAIYRNLQWGWVLGIAVSCISIILWLTQETVGLPGLPKMWFEPSRIIALIIELYFIFLARNLLGTNSHRKS